MSLAQLNVHDFRNIASEQLTLHPRCNVVYGANGSGKTALMEALYVLGTGHSFCTRDTASLVRSGASSLTVFARTDTQQTMSIQKSIAQATQIKINQEHCSRSSDLAYFLPCQAFHQGIFQIMNEGPSVRRRLLDWGLFHVKQSYLSVWNDYRRIVKQRNALLRQKAHSSLFQPWDTLLVDRANALHEMRSAYFEAWSSAFQTMVTQLTDVPCAIYYDKGWDKKGTGKSLSEILVEQFDRDLRLQYTNSGAHHADITFESGYLKAKSSFSRGQQKIILIALQLAQAHLLQKPCVYLFDDVTAELDTMHAMRFFHGLSCMQGQFFFTAMDPSPWRAMGLDSNSAAFFSVKQGRFHQEILL